jgi:hypothetical protein
VEGNNFNYEKTYHSHAARDRRIRSEFLHHGGGKAGGTGDNDNDNVDHQESGNADHDAGDDGPFDRLLGRFEGLRIGKGIRSGGSLFFLD